MARPSKSVSVTNKNLTKEERAIRLDTEQKLKGGADKIIPPTHLTERQSDIFNYIVEEMKASGILGNLDIYILEEAVIAIDRLQQIEKSINDDIGLLLDRNLRSARKEYRDTFFRCCNELSLSPQSRAKLGNIKVQAKEQSEDPLLKVLKGGK